MPQGAQNKRVSGLSHIGAEGNARMVDVAEKAVTERTAVAEGFVRISAELAAEVRENTLAKGNLLEVARLAGIQGAKRTAELIPLCHPLPLDHVDVAVAMDGERIAIRASAKAHGRTGVEMEALAAVCAAALTVIDMGKSVDRGMVIEGVRVVEKRGGKSGDYVAGERR